MPDICFLDVSGPLKRNWRNCLVSMYIREAEHRLSINLSCYCRGHSNTYEGIASSGEHAYLCYWKHVQGCELTPSIFDHLF